MCHGAHPRAWRARELAEVHPPLHVVEVDSYEVEALRKRPGDAHHLVEVLRVDELLLLPRRQLALQQVPMLVEVDGRPLVGEAHGDREVEVTAVVIAEEVVVAGDPALVQQQLLDQDLRLDQAVVELSGPDSEGLVQHAIEVTDRLGDVELLLVVHDLVTATAVARLDDELAGEVVEDLRAQPMMDAQRRHQVVLTDPLGYVVPDTYLVGDPRVGLVVAVELAILVRKKKKLKDIDMNIIQYISILGSLVFIGLIIMLIRNKRIKEEFAILWLFFGGVFLFLSIWRGSLEVIARILGIAYAPAAIFLILIIAIISILIHLSLITSKLTDQAKVMIQELGLLKMEMDTMKKQSKTDPPEDSHTEG